jgi:hypothetical protein
VTIDRVVTHCTEGATTSGCAVVTGTMTCDGVGPAFEVNIRLTQRDASGVTNSDLLDFACSTEPTPFRVFIESFYCDTPNDPDCYWPGRATATATFRGTVLAQETVRIKKSK